MIAVHITVTCLVCLMLVRASVVEILRSNHNREGGART